MSLLRALCFRTDSSPRRRAGPSTAAGVRRPGVFEQLETRRLMIAEGDLFVVNETLNAAGLVGSLSSTIHWGDGTQTSEVVSGGDATGGLQVRLDYSLDTAGFFASPTRRDLLQSAVDALADRVTDDLAAISPSGSNSWKAAVLHPATGGQHQIVNPTIAANEIVIYAGARDLPGSQLGEGGPGGFSASGTQAWLDKVRGRGEAGALTASPTDIGPWGGSIAFDTHANWYFGKEPDGLAATQEDFVTVATHELAHLFGFGTSPAWSGLTSGGVFTGPKATTEYDGAGNPPISSGGGHFTSDVTDGGQQTLMSTSIRTGTRKLLTPLDFAALDDIGWDVVDTRAIVTGSHIYSDNGQFPVQIVLAGSEFGEITYPLDATISNVAPALTLVGDQAAVTGQPLLLADIGLIRDPGFRNLHADPSTFETFSYVIDWGDGTPAEQGTATVDRAGNVSEPTLASFDGSHAYAQPGSYTVSVRATDDDGGTVQKSFVVTVTDPPALSLELSDATVAENAGAAATTLTIRRSGPASSSPTTVMLASSDTTEAVLPASVVIPAGQTSVTTTVDAIDDDLLDATQTAQLSASASGLDSASVDLAVSDAEFLTAAFDHANLLESAGGDSLRLTVQRSNTDIASDLEVAISGGNASQMNMPPSVTIPAGQSEVSLLLSPVDDALDEPPLDLSYVFTAAGYADGTAELTLLDDEQPLYQNAVNSFDVDGSDHVSARDALVIINQLNIRSGDTDLVAHADRFAGLFIDVTGDYRLTALDALLVINALNQQLQTTVAAGESLSSESSSSGPLSSESVFAQPLFAPPAPADEDEPEDGSDDEWWVLDLDRSRKLV